MALAACSLWYLVTTLSWDHIPQKHVTPHPTELQLKYSIVFLGGLNMEFPSAGALPGAGAPGGGAGERANGDWERGLNGDRRGDRETITLYAKVQYIYCVCMAIPYICV